MFSVVRYTNRGNYVISSGVTSNTFSGVSFIISKKLSDRILGFDSISDRIIKLKIDAHPYCINLIQVYAPTSDSTEEAITNFYLALAKVYVDIPNKEPTLVIGDFNAKIGKSSVDDHLKGIIGNHGLGDRNSRGQMLLDFCAENNISIMNTWFQQHPRRLYTWISPNGKYKNQIDYIMINRRWRSTILCSKTRPGADCGSDHQLLVATLKIRLKAQRKPQFNAIKVTRDALETFKDLIIPRLQQIDCDPFELPEATWSKLKATTLATAKEIKANQNPVPRAEWISAETWTAIMDRKKLKETGISSGPQHQEYRKLHHKVQNLCRRDINAHITNICNEIEKSSNTSNTKDLFDKVRTITRQFKPRNWSVEDAHGKVLIDKNEVLDVWRPDYQRRRLRKRGGAQSTAGKICDEAIGKDMEEQRH
ncbi:uncharacterized protein [Epargyreus clarus]|uniref:uncharacterized protein n=1 Tax=Epargyreus clarus TaxID=520877 RepID=UPI003C30807C